MAPKKDARDTKNKKGKVILLKSTASFTFLDLYKTQEQLKKLIVA